MDKTTIAAALNITPDEIMIYEVHNNYIGVVTNSFEKLTCPLPLPRQTTTAVSYNTQAVSTAPSLQDLAGIGQTAARLLISINIHTPADLAAADVVEVASLPRVGMSKAQTWIDAAKEATRGE